MKSTAAFTPEDMRKVEVAPDPGSKSGQRREPSAKLAALADALGGLSARPPYSPVVLVGLARGAEFLVLVAAGLVAQRFYGTSGSGLICGAVNAAVSGIALLAFQALGTYSVASFRDPIGRGIRVALCWTLIAAMTGSIVFGFGLRATISPIWLAGWYAFGLGSLLIGRGGLSLITGALTRSGRLDRRTVLVGGGPAAESLLRSLSDQGETGIRVLGIFDDRDDARSPESVAGCPKLGNIDDLVDFARHTRMDLVIFTLPISAEQRILQMLRKLWVLPIDIRLAAHTNKLRFRPRSYSYIGAVPVLDVFDKPIADWDVVSKAVFDRVVGALALAVLFPVLLATAIAVKLDSRGPVLFRQKRYGFNNELIEVFKFRSMYADRLDPTASRLVTKADPRVTRVGRFIRKTSLDELPQLINVVFKGDLSLVGPRPHAVHAKAADRQYDEVVDGYFARHRVRPGITGWAQVKGWRGETDTPIKIQRRVEHDLAYIENWSLLFDLYILLVTPFALTRTDSAY